MKKFIFNNPNYINYDVPRVEEIRAFCTKSPIKRDCTENLLPLTAGQELEFYRSFFKALNISFVYAASKALTKASSTADGHFLVGSKLLKKEQKKRQPLNTMRHFH